MREYTEIDLLEEIRSEAKGQIVERIRLAEVVKIKPKLTIKFNGIEEDADNLYMLNSLLERQKGRNTTVDAKHSHAVLYNKLKVGDTVMIYYYPNNIIILDKVVAINGR